MASPTPQTKIVQLSPFDLMGPVHFTRLLLFFQAPDTNHMTIRSHVTASLAVMVKRDPFVAGKVYTPPTGHRYLAFSTTVPENFDPQRNGMLQFQYAEDDYAALREGGFAGVPGEAEYYHWLEARLAAGDTDVLPLLAFHVTFVRGGFALALWSNHAVLDGASTARVMRLWVEALQVVSTVSEEAANSLPLAPAIDVDKEIGLQSWHMLPSEVTDSCSERPDGLISLDESTSEANVNPSEIVSRTFTFLTKDLQRIRRPDGSSTAPFRCAAALLLVAVLRARSKAGLIPKDATTATAGIVSSFREALKVPSTALGNYAGYHSTTFPLQDLLNNNESLSTILSKTLEHITTLISISKHPHPTHARLAWLTHQLMHHATNPHSIFYGPPSTTSPATSIIFNTWEMLGSEAEYVQMLGVLQCVRKPHVSTSGQVLFMPVVGGEREEVLRCTAGLEEMAMGFLEAELEVGGWTVSDA